MGTTRLRYTGYGLFLLVATGALLMAWMRLSFGLFLVIASTFAAFLAVFVVVRDGWNQTSTDSLNSRGIYPESMRSLRVMDPGLRREYSPLVPAFVRHRMPGSRSRRRPARTATARPACSGPTRSRRRPAAPSRRSARRGSGFRQTWCLTMVPGEQEATGSAGRAEPT